MRVVDASTGAPFKTLRDPVGPFCSPAFSPDGERIVASGCPYTSTRRRGPWYGTWPPAGGSPRCQASNINGLMFSPDGERLAGRYYPQAAIWDAWTGERLLTISGHSGDVFGVAFSRDGTRLATGSADGTARIWDAQSGEELVRLSGHGGLVALVDFSPDGTRLLTGGGDGTARVWDVSETAGAEVWSERVASEWVGSLEYDADGTRLVTADGGGGWELDPSTGEGLAPIGTAGWDVSFDPSGDRVAASSDGASVMDLESGEVVRTFEVTGWVASIEYSPDGSLVATGLGDTDLGRGRAVLWDAASGRRVRTLGPSHPEAICGPGVQPGRRDARRPQRPRAAGGVGRWTLGSG